MVKGEVHNFSRGSIPRNIMSLALPMTAAQLINVLYSVVDRVYLGRLPPNRIHHHGICQPVRNWRRAAVFHQTGPGRQ